MPTMAETKVNYKVKVININTHLRIRDGAGTTHNIVGRRNNGDTFEVDRVKTLPSGEIWYRQKGTDKWSCAKTSSGQKYIKITQNLDKNSGSSKPEKKDGKAPRQPKVTTQHDDVKTDNTTVNSDSYMGIPNDTMAFAMAFGNNTSAIEGKGSASTEWQTHYIIQRKGYPVPDENSGYMDISITSKNAKGEVTNTATGRTYNINNYSMWDIASDDKYQKRLRSIKRSINAPTAWTTNELYKMTFLNFNRFKMDFPDLNLKGSRAAIFVTRPALNLLMNDSSSDIGISIRDSTKITKADERKRAGEGGIISDIRIYNLLRENITLGELLSLKNKCSPEHGLNKHNFNPLLSNQAYGIDVKDDQVDVLETGETVTGYKIQYSKHNNKSMGMDSVTIKYKELHDLSIMKLHQIWVDYQSDVYKGILNPRYRYIWKRELDYLCNIYYFLLAEDGETILFWSKYYGAFPVNVPKSVLSYDRGSQVAQPEVSVTYNYIFKEDLSPQALVEFNEDAGLKSSDNTYDTYGYHYVPVQQWGNHGENTLHTGSTWVGNPFIQSVVRNDDLGNPGSYDLKLRFRVLEDNMNQD